MTQSEMRPADNNSTNQSWSGTSSGGLQISTLSPLFAVIYGIQSFTGFLGNFVAIWVLSKLVKSSSTPTNYCMLNLSIADWVFSTLVVPVIAQTLCYPHMSPWKLIDSNLLCKIFVTYQSVVVYVSIFTMILMTVDRYLAVVHPIATMGFRTPRNTILILFAIWAVSISFSLPQFTMGTIEPSMAMCYINWAMMAGRMKIPPSYILRFFAGFTFVFTYLIPLSVIVVIYYRIIKVLRQREAARFRDPGPSRSTATTKAAGNTRESNVDEMNMDKNGINEATEKTNGKKIASANQHRGENSRLNEQAMAARRRNERTTKLVMIVVLLFAICLLPLQVQFHIWAFDDTQKLYYLAPFLSELFMRVVYVFFFLNSIVNPFVYTFQCQPFKEALRESIPQFISSYFGNRSGRRTIPNQTEMTNTYKCSEA